MSTFRGATTQPLKKGACVYRWLFQEEIYGNDTLDFTFTGLDKDAYPMYAFSTNAFRGEGNNRMLSYNSPRMLVDLLNGESVSDYIEKIYDQPEIMEIARFTIDGHKVTQPVKGINIIVYSDGSTRKEIVK